MAQKIKTLIISKMAERRQTLQAMLSDNELSCDTVESNTLALDRLNTMKKMHYHFVSVSILVSQNQRLSL